VLTPDMKSVLRPAIIAFPLTIKSDAEITLLANLITLTPGTLSVDVSEDRSDLRVFINPEITRREGVAVNQEGCLSVAGIFDNVERAESVTVTALDRNGSRFTLNASGMLAACIQHEMDHLEGKVFIDYLSDLKQNRIRAKLKKRQRKAA